MFGFYLKKIRMLFNRFSKIVINLFFIIILFSCNEDECTKMVNIPKWDANLMTFVDDIQEVPCDFEEPVDEPVN